ncbi:MAG: DUF5107 domain-containing protein [Acidobacteria bacterium]|nr:DUF5107 domain-containing protein [Acidobacteriota bacterium]
MKLALLFLPTLVLAQSPAVRSSEGSITIPTYTHSGRELEPALFPQSTVSGLYPFPSFLSPFQPGDPKPHTYKAVFIENEYLKLTYLPELGGHFFSLYDKLRRREVWYRNDVIKPAPYNPRNGWPQSGAELTGPHDLHTLTLHGEPFWAHQLVPHSDGSLSLVLGQLDPVYQMKVNFSATLHPGLAALQLDIFCFNTRTARMPQMLWVNTAISATPETRFLYSMSRTVGHTTADIADWPVYNGTDYSWNRNNRNMLGVFGIDIYADYHGAYAFDRDYGLFRLADRRQVQGMKLWTFGTGPTAQNHEHGYTDKAGPYVELQSGRHVWDGHYEWIPPHHAEAWSEWWIPVAGTGGLTALSRDVALNLTEQSNSVTLTFAATRLHPAATLNVQLGMQKLLTQTIRLDPAKPVKVELPNAKAPGLHITIGAKDQIFDYTHPTEAPGRKEYTPFTAPLEKPRKAAEQMSAEELTFAAENRFKELDPAGAAALLDKALALDPGYSRAHLQYGIHHYLNARYPAAIESLQKAIDRDPYCDEAHYYLSMARLALAEPARAERQLYYIWPGSPFYGPREYQLARLAFFRNNTPEAKGHLEKALSVNDGDLNSRLFLALLQRLSHEPAEAARHLAAAEKIDPTSRIARAERYFLAPTPAAKSALLRLLGSQTQEALGVSVFYQDLRQWRDAAALLALLTPTNSDPYGTTPEFYYTLAYAYRQAGDGAKHVEALNQARASAKNIDRFPFRPESEAVFSAAISDNPRDPVARFALGCLLYFRGRASEAIVQWKSAAELDPRNFSVHRALGLAYAAQNIEPAQAAAELEKAVALNPAHIRTINDLSALYARAGNFEAQLAVLQKALARSPGDDDLAEGVFTAYLAQGNYAAAAELIRAHRFAVRHRSYGLRDKYRLMQSGAGAQAFNKGDYAAALTLFTAALTPPESLGVDDFATQTSPRLSYYIGRALEALGRTAEAKQAYEKALAGLPYLTGDRDSWSSENFHMIFALARLGRSAELAALRDKFIHFAETERNDKAPQHRAEALYLLGLAEKQAGHSEEARRLMAASVEALPDFLPARLDLRNDVPAER